VGRNTGFAPRIKPWFAVLFVASSAAASAAGCSKDSEHRQAEALEDFKLMLTRDHSEGSTPDYTVNVDGAGTVSFQNLGCAEKVPAYCRDIEAFCPDEFPTPQACATRCFNGYSADGRTCRITHLNLAKAEADGSTGRATHCGHAGPTGGGDGGPCANQ
jgi:hypothetical protein